MPSALQQAIGTSRKVDWSQFEGPAALRCTVGVAVPLLAGLLFGQRTAGVFGAVGAVSVGFGSFQGVYRSRAAIMLTAAAGMAFSVFVGSLAGGSTLAAIVAAGVWGFVSGLLVSLGPGGSYVGLRSAVAMLVASGFPSDTGTAIGRLAAVFAGGAIQTLLVVVLWPLRRYPAERRALAIVYRSLASYAFRLPQGLLTPPDPNSIEEAQEAFRDPQPFAKVWQALALRSLLDEAERIRASLAALALHGPPATDARLDPDPRAFAIFADSVGQLLREIGNALDEAREPSAPEFWLSLESAAAQLHGSRHLIDGLLGQLRAAWRVGGVMSGPRPDRTESTDPVRPLRRLPPIGDAFNTLRANLTLESTTFRHAIRLGVTLAIATEVYRWLELPRGYWVPMTALLVLKPEFHGTFATGLARVAGTLVGAAGAALITVALGPGPFTLVLLVLGFVWCGYAFSRTNYTIFVVCITGYVVFLLALAGVPESTAARYRSLDTALGGVLALVVYAAWPTWEGSQVRQAIADLIDAHRRYVTALFGGLIDASKRDRTRLGAARANARLARSNAEASVQRMLGEPASRRAMSGDVALGLLAASRRHALAALALQARIEREPRDPPPELERLATEIVTTLAELARAVREGTVPKDLPPLRATQEQIRALTRSSLMDETDVMVDSLNTIAEMLGGHRVAS